ncbi:glyoxalase [Pseudoroseomonas deserti]|uniref:Glyoxalase n=1 Tax=Teichococcus deserti TaxID=1817963 RepID=A0A1V2H6B7_9PROT|nr:VOC family protein [Pseudoroseomonas deserti]ONG55673.1 glyoxalase [Pseudoroseomonas deserti]
MLSHVCLGIGDFDRSFAFYDPLMALLGHRLRFKDAQKPWAAWQPAGDDRPLLLIGAPFDGGPAAPGNGGMVALLAPDRATVDAGHALALRQGGACEGPPGLRPQYHPNFYGGYFRDPDGNKLCLCCHQPES